MAYATVVGVNLSPVRGKGAKQLARGLNFLAKKVEQMASGKIMYAEIPAFKFFTKVGDPVTNAPGDSPGSDFSFIWNVTDSKLFFVHTWLAANSFVVLEMTLAT